MGQLGDVVAAGEDPGDAAVGLDGFTDGSEQVLGENAAADAAVDSVLFQPERQLPSNCLPGWRSLFWVTETRDPRLWPRSGRPCSGGQCSGRPLRAREGTGRLLFQLRSPAWPPPSAALIRTCSIPSWLGGKVSTWTSTSFFRP